MRKLDEYDIMHNSTIGAIALWSFTLEFYNSTKRERGPNLPLLMLVLPMVLHKQTALSIYKRKMAGGLYRTLSEDKVILAGLQHRIQAMSDQTFKALNIAFASQLLYYNQSYAEVIPIELIPIKTSNMEIKRITAAAKRLGHWFSDLDLLQINALLNLRW